MNWNFAINKDSQSFDKGFICKLNVFYNARHIALKIDEDKNGR